ncbi:MAG: sigma-54-dependent Fis family transcriptional regulator [Acidobacteria bacterium]|nr:sigma-54-dependent Fis family transcriptional regulator [Acidobacteriota bacterium]
MSDATIVASRFALVDGRGSIDLATGLPVRLVVTAVGDRGEQARWADGCESRRRTPGSVPRLIDYGRLGSTRRFEAWSADSSAGGKIGAGRRAVSAIEELFDRLDDCRPRVVALVGGSPADRAEAILELARLARAAGLVPVALRLLTDALRTAIGGQTMLLIAEAGATRTWPALVSTAISAPRPHVLVLSGKEEVAGVDCIVLESDRRGAAGCRATGVVDRRVAEQPAVYQAAADLPRAAPAPAPGSARHSGDIGLLERRAAEARRLMACGRHAPGERQLRQAIGALARREAWTPAGRAALDLAGALLERGRPREAQASLENCRLYAARADDATRLLEAAALAGQAWIDLACLDEAESVLVAGRAAVGAGVGGEAAGDDLALALARCLFWRGRYADADVVARALERSDGNPAGIAAIVASARNAVGLRDVGRALALAAEGGRRAAAIGDAALASSAAAAAALAHLSVSDFAAVARDAEAAIGLARAARAPLRAARARLLLAEAERRQNRRGAPHLLLRRLARVGASQWPPVVGARAALLGALARPGMSPREAVAQTVGATGLVALALFAPDVGSAPSALPHAAPAIARVLPILEQCQSAADEQPVLARVCALLRGDLRAAAVAIFAAGRADVPALASDGARIDHEIARRAAAARMLIAPHRLDDRIEAAVPVCWAGAPIAAIAVRWTLGSAHELAAAGDLLALAAAATAPVAAALLARRAVAVSSEPIGILGVSAVAADLRHAVACAAAAPFPVLVQGESGSGKELVARALHRGSPRRARPFCALNCAALPDELVESELFGHARGAFTGAVAERSGIFEEASGGTVFLDEVGELSPRAQAKLLRLVQDGEFRRVGENLARRADVRIVSATNRDLRAEATAGRFRLDLLYRLDVIRVAVAPLRERREDVAVLAEHIWADAAARVGSSATLAAGTIAALARYDWPGNVRELQNVLAALAVRAAKRGLVPPSALPPLFAEAVPQPAWRLDAARRGFEEQYVRAALTRTGGRCAQAAAELGLSRQGLAKLMSRLGIARPSDGESARALEVAGREDQPARTRG